MRNIKVRPWKTMSLVLVMIFGLIAGLMAMLKNPSKADSEAHLETMIRDMGAAVKMGGVVDSTYSNAKSGGALLIKNVNANSWSLDLAKAYQRELIRRGWVKKNSDGNVVVLCKDGMLARINDFPEKDSSRGLTRDVYGFAMIYDARTKRKCD